MGRAWCDDVFDPVAEKTRELGIPDHKRTEILVVLIKSLQDNDWDVEGESLAKFDGDKAVIDAFRRCGIIVQCGLTTRIGNCSYWCEREQGPLGHADGQHEEAGVKWPVTA